LLCMRVLILRIAPEHLTAVWPVVMAELQRLLLYPHATRPTLLLSACQLIDILLTVLPEDFAPFGWMFIPQVPSTLATEANVDNNEISHDDHCDCSQYSREIGGDACYVMSPTHKSEFTALLQPLCTLGARAEVSHGFHGLLQPSVDGRRRPLLGMRTLHHVSELAPFASRLTSHLKTSVLLPRSAEVDMPFLELVLGCEFIPAKEAAATFAPHRRRAGKSFPNSPSSSARGLWATDSAKVDMTDSAHVPS